MHNRIKTIIGIGPGDGFQLFRQTENFMKDNDPAFAFPPCIRNEGFKSRLVSGRDNNRFFPDSHFLFVSIASIVDGAALGTHKNLDENWGFWKLMIMLFNIIQNDTDFRSL